MRTERVVSAYYDRKLIVEEDMGIYLFIYRIRFETQHKIDFPFLKHFKYIAHGAAGDVQFDSGILGGELLDAFRKDGRKSVRYPYIKCTRQHLFEITNLDKTLFRVLQGADCYRKQVFSAFGKDDGVAAS